MFCDFVLCEKMICDFVNCYFFVNWFLFVNMTGYNNVLTEHDCVRVVRETTISCQIQLLVHVASDERTYVTGRLLTTYSTNFRYQSSKMLRCEEGVFSDRFP